MTFSRSVLLAASIAASAAFAPALAQEHEVGHWFSAPGASSAPAMAAQPVFVGGVLVASGDVSGDGRQYNGYVSRFSAGGRAHAVPAILLDDLPLQTRNATQETRQTHYYDITLKNVHVAAGGDRDMTLKGQNILQNAREIRPVAGVGSSDSTTWARTVQPHTSTSASTLPPQMGWGPWELQPGRGLKTAPPAAGMRPGLMPGGYAAPTRR